MSILIDKNTRVMTQGITGKTGMFHTQTGRAYANGKECYVAGVNPKKAGERIFDKGDAAGMTQGLYQLDDPFHTYEVELEVQDLAHLTRIVSALRASDAVAEADRI